MSRRWALLLPLALFVAICIFLLFGLFSDPRKLESALVGQPVPQFQLPALMSEQSLSHADLPKTPYLLNVWATWCPTCYAEHQFLNQLAAEGVVIVGLNYKDERAKAQRWIRELGNPYQLLLEDASGQMALDLGVYGAPETYMVDAQGQIVYRHVGDLNPRVWQSLAPKFAALQQTGESHVETY